MRPEWDCLSPESTQLLFDRLNPRAVFAGHSHFGCVRRWPTRGDALEYTVASFSWRNNVNPAFLLATIGPNEVLIEKCPMPREQTVFRVYGMAAVIALMMLATQLYSSCGCARLFGGKKGKSYY